MCHVKVGFPTKRQIGDLNLAASVISKFFIHQVIWHVVTQLFCVMVGFVMVGFPTKHPPLSTDGRLNLWSLLQLTMRLHEAKKGLG